MNEEEGLALSNEKLDAKAKELFGPPDPKRVGRQGRDVHMSGGVWKWSPSTDIAAAWELVERMRAERLQPSVFAPSPYAGEDGEDGNWTVCFTHPYSPTGGTTEEDDHYFEADTGPRAITTAFIAAMTELRSNA